MQLRDAADYDPTWMTKARVKRAPPERADVAVVGAGLGGLTAGTYLARASIKVAVFDQHYVAGGCCTQFSRGGPRNRYNFDIGLHYIGDCGPEGKIPQILAGLDIDLDVVPLDADGFDVLVFPEFRFPIPVGLDAFRDRFAQMSPRERRGIDRYVRFLREIDELLTRVDRSKGRMSWGIAWHALTRGRLAGKYREATLEDLLDSCSRDPQVRAVMAGQNGDYGSAAEPGQCRTAWMIARVDALFPGSRDTVEFCESATPMSHIRYTRATDGTGYGLAATPAQFFEHRPGYSGPLPGLFFAGASTRAGHGVLGAMLSGQRCARRIAREFGAVLAEPAT